MSKRIRRTDITVPCSIVSTSPILGFGDMPLTEVARRPTDCVARYYAEEFVVVLPNTDATGIQHVGEHLIEIIRKLTVAHLGSPFKKLTVSVGGAIVEDGSLDIEKVIERADKNLYLT